MDDEIETLLVDVRASTTGFKADIESMRMSLDSTLVDGFARAGTVLERGLLSAIRRGSLGFDDLKRTAFHALNEIAAQALQLGLDQLFGGQGGGFLGTVFNGALGGLLGLPGRATGGPVAPGTAYLIGERGPEVFVPTSSGRVEALDQAGSPPRDVRVAIHLAAPRGSDTPAMLRRSTRQVASAVRRAMTEI